MTGLEMVVTADPERLYSVVEASYFLAMGAESIRRMVQAGELAAVRTSEHRQAKIYIRRADLIEWQRRNLILWTPDMPRRGHNLNRDQRTGKYVRKCSPTSAEQSRPNPDKPPLPPGAAPPTSDEP